MTRYKTTEVYTYTETVYYEDGKEVFRDRNYDDSWYDTRETDYDLEDWEIADYYEGDQ